MAVSATLSQLGPRFGIGTNVSAYLRSQWTRGVLSGAPSGGAVAGPVAIDTNGNATFAGLNPDTEYIIYANVSGQDVYIQFFSGTGGTMGSARDVEVVSSVAAAGGGVTGIPADAFANPAAAIAEEMGFLMVFNGTTWERVRSVGGADTSQTGVMAVGLNAWNGGQGFPRGLWSAADANPRERVLAAAQQIFNGTQLDLSRTPTTFKSISAVAITAGTGATVWTPTAGKKFRLMGYLLSVSAAAGLIFGDNLVGTVLHRSPLLAAAGVIVVGADMLGNGQLSAAANNVLKLDVTATATVTGVVFGTEE